jgi:hypothetical protein
MGCTLSSLSIRLSVLSCAALATLAACGPAETPTEEPGSPPEASAGLPPPETGDGVELAAKGPSDLGAEGDDAVNLGSHYCCQITWFEDPQPFMCIGYKTLKAWAVSKCAATAASIPGTYPTLASGQCSNYVECWGLP